MAKSQPTRLCLRFQCFTLLRLFTSRGCPPCVTLKKALSSAARVKWLKKNRIGLVICDIDKNEESAASYRVKMTPTLVAELPGGKTMKQEGYWGAEELDAFLLKVTRRVAKLSRQPR